MRNTLFNDEVEGYTYNSNTRIIILSIVLLAVFISIGWLMSIAVHMLTVMDVYVDSQVEEEVLLDELLSK